MTVNPEGPLIWRHDRQIDVDQDAAAQLKALNSLTETWSKELHDSTYDGIRGGLEALRHDGFKGLLDYFGDRLMRTVLDNVAEGLTQAFLSSGGGGGGFFGSLFAGLFTGFHANGGYIPAGKWGIAGERGAEAVFGGRTGATVLPNSSMGGGPSEVAHPHHPLALLRRARAADLRSDRGQGGRSLLPGGRPRRAGRPGGASEVQGLMTTPLVPLGLFGLQNVGPPRLVRRIVSGGEALDGAMAQGADQSAGGAWMIEASGQLIEEDKIKAWAQLMAQIGDGITPATVEWPVHLFQPLRDPPVRRVFQWPPVAWAGIKQVAAQLTSDAALRATTLVMSFNGPVLLVGGEYLSIVHSTWGERGYQVREVVSQSATAATVKIRPPLRQAAAAATPTVIDFDNPRCLMTGQLSMDLSLGKFAQVQASFRESRQVA
jgi:hypothetical protein